MKFYKLLFLVTSLSALSLSCGNVIGGAIEAAKQAKLDPAPQPSFSLAGGIYTNAEELTLSSPVSGARIRYTNDGSSPTESNGLSYSGPILLTASQTIKAICLADGYNKSAIAQEDYEITGTVAVPTFSHETGAYNGRQHVVLSSITSDVTIYYTTDGTNPTKSSALYAEPIEVFDDTQIKAKAVRNDWLDSPINSASYEISYTVQFSVQGSPVTTIPDRAGLKFNDPAGIAPTIPTNNNAYFDGWYKELDCINAWNFSADVVADNTTLYAKWHQDIVSPTIGRLKYVPPGRFQRDGNAANISVLTKPYYVAQHEVTRAQFRTIMDADPSVTLRSRGTNNPVQDVNWYQAIAFCNMLSIAEGLTPVYQVRMYGTLVDFTNFTFSAIPLDNDSFWDSPEVNWNANGYRLPTQMEWMWAAMGAPRDGQLGATNYTGYLKSFAGSTGTNIVTDYAVIGNTSEGVFGANKSFHVGSKLPNELGLFDLTGNVFEWCWDWHETYPNNLLVNYRGSILGETRSKRGGSYGTGNYVGIGTQRSNFPIDRSYMLGFRVVRN